MTNLELIEILIEENKKEIELIKNMIAEDEKYPSIKKVNEENLKSMEELLADLQQVKTDLEAWEVVKSGITQKLQITGKYRDKVVEINHRIYVEGTEQYEKLKKALEEKYE